MLLKFLIGSVSVAARLYSGNEKTVICLFQEEVFINSLRSCRMHTFLLALRANRKIIFQILNFLPGDYVYVHLFI